MINAEFWVLWCVQGEKDWQKYETARKLKLRVDAIRHEYQMAWTSREMKQRQRGVALYFIDRVDFTSMMIKKNKNIQSKSANEIN